MVTTKIGKGDIFSQNLPVQQVQNAFGKCSDYNEIQAGRGLANRNEKPLQLPPAHLHLLWPPSSWAAQCPALPSETCRTAPWQGFCVGTVVFHVLFVLSVDISKSPLASVSQDRFPSASLLQSTHFCRQTSSQVLFALGVHQSYSTMQQLLLGNVLLSLRLCPVYFPCGMSQLGCRPSDERDCLFFMYLEIPTVLLQPEYYFFFLLSLS